MILSIPVVLPLHVSMLPVVARMIGALTAPVVILSVAALMTGAGAVLLRAPLLLHIVPGASVAHSGFTPDFM